MLGSDDGIVEKTMDGSTVEPSVETTAGSNDGSAEGPDDEAVLGTDDGVVEGTKDGSTVGTSVKSTDGFDDE